MEKKLFLIVSIIILIISGVFIKFLFYYKNNSSVVIPKSLGVTQIGPPSFLFSIDGKQDPNTKRELELTPKGFKNPLAVEASRDGLIFVADTGNKRIVKFKFDGSYVTSFGQGQLDYPCALLYVNYKLYVVEPNLMKIAVYNYLGQELPPLLDKMLLDRERNDGTGEKDFFVRPTAIQLGPDGLFYITDVGNQAVIVLDYNGKFVRRFGMNEAEYGTFQYPGGLAINKNGDVYVADSNKGRIFGFDYHGQFLTKIDGRQGKNGHLALPKGIAIYPNGTIVVTDVLLHRVRAFDLVGNELWSIGGMGKKNGQFYFPNNLCLDVKERLYVADRENNRVQVFSE